MSQTCDEPPTVSMAQLSADEARGWRVVLRALGLMHGSLCWALFVSCVTVTLWFIMDRSDRALALVILGVGHLALAFPHVIGLFLCCLAPLGSETRRNAQQLAVLILTGVLLALLIGAIGIGRVLGVWGGPVTLANPAGLALATMAVSWSVNVALVGYIAVGLHAALGRDLGNPKITAAPLRLRGYWIAFCAAGAAMLLWKVFELPISRIVAVGFPPGFVVIGLAGIVLIVLEVLYLRLIHQSRTAMRLVHGEPSEFHAGTIGNADTQRRSSHT